MGMLNYTHVSTYSIAPHPFEPCMLCWIICVIFWENYEYTLELHVATCKIFWNIWLDS